MNKTELFVCLLAVGLIACDLLVRLRTHRHRKDRFIESLFDTLLQPALLPQSSTKSPVPKPANLPTPESLAENLLRHFQQSAVSRLVLRILALQQGGAAEAGLLAEVNQHLVQTGKRALPPAVVRRVVMILMGADLVALNQGRLEITNAGRQLNTLLEARSLTEQTHPSFG